MAKNIKVSTTEKFISSFSGSVPVGTVVETLGYSTEGDGGGASWKKTATTGTASQSPAQLGAPLLNDATGNQWSLVKTDGHEVLVDSLGAIGDMVADDTLAIIAANNTEIIGSTSDDPAIPYRRSTTTFGDKPYRITGDIVIPVGVSWLGAPQSTDYNAAGLGNTPFGSVIFLDATSSVPEISVEGKQLRGSAASMENMKFWQGFTQQAAGQHVGTVLTLNGAFMYNIKNCDFSEIGYTTALKGVASNGVSVDSCRFIKIGDANSQQAMPPASGYTYGNAIDFTTCYDSWITNTFIEACGGTGIIISTNTKVEGCFVDLNKVGIHSLADRNQIVGSSVKWNQTDGIQLTSSHGIVISSNIIMGNNYASSAIASTIGYGIRFNATATKYFNISNNNMVDDYESVPSHNPYKTVRQGGINLGSSALTTGIINGVIFSDEDAQWDATIKSEYPVTDGQAQISTGLVMLGMSMLESAGAANGRHVPFTTAGGTTLGTVTRRIAYRDKNGAVVGQIPLYDTITT
jgi:hypothetical protein